MQDAVEDSKEDVMINEDIALYGVGVVPVAYIKVHNNVDIQILCLENLDLVRKIAENNCKD